MNAVMAHLRKKKLTVDNDTLLFNISNLIQFSFIRKFERQIFVAFHDHPIYKSLANFVGEVMEDLVLIADSKTELELN